jgi:DNA-binding NarL/FixJ family response regulator
VRVCAWVPDLMDRSRITAAVPAVSFVRDVAECAGADCVVIDLGVGADAVAAARAVAPEARLVCFGPHVDRELADAARAAGADDVMPRSQFFRDPAAAVGSYR